MSVPDAEFKLDRMDIRFDTFTSGPKVQVRAMHMPSGLAVTCSDHPTIRQNKETAVQWLTEAYLGWRQGT